MLDRARWLLARLPILIVLLALVPPSVSFAFGLGTESSSWMAGGGHFGSYLEDRIR